MRVFAYVDQRYQYATRAVVGNEATLLTSPPVFAADFNSIWLNGQDFIYIDLHGQPYGVYLYSGPGQLSGALGLATVRHARLSGAVVFATTCYLPRSHFLEAFLTAGARAVIAGAGVNWGTRGRLSGAQLLARSVLRQIESGLPVEAALAEAKRRLRLSPRRLWEREATEDALAFRLFAREHVKREAASVERGA